MKVLMTADTVGGVWSYALALCEALQSHDVSVELATMGRSLSDQQRQQVRRLGNVVLHESSYRLCWMADSERDVAEAGKWLLQLEQQVQPDIVHLNDLGHGNLPWQSPVLLVAHSCVYSWWYSVKRLSPPAAEWQKYHTLVSAGLANAQLLVAPTYAMLAAFEQHYGSGTPTASTVIANGRAFPALATAAHLDQQKQPLLFAAGRVWDDAKNLGVLAHIAPQLPWPVFIAGETDDPNGGEHQHQGAYALGFLNEAEMAVWLKRAAIYVAPAKYEPFGLAILEAARAGCVLVLGDIPSLREVWGEAAVYVDPEQPAALRQTLLDLIAAPERRRDLAQAAWQRAQQYSPFQMAAAYHTQYQRLKHLRPALNPSHAKAIAGANP